MIGYGAAYPKEGTQNVHIHHNIFYSTGTNPSIDWVGGIVACGFYDTLIENNVFDGVYNAAVVHMYPTDVHAGTELSPTGTGYTTFVRNNIIVNTLKRTKDSGGTGYAVINNLPDSHTVTLDNNCLYNNAGGNYRNASSTTDIYAAPLFADQKNHNYHLKSKAGRWNGVNWVNDSVSSPCIDTGYPLSDYFNEPEPNGGRVNIGSDGNTGYASKSESNVSMPVLPTANFSSNVTTGYAPLSVDFNVVSTGTPNLWNWNFGDRTKNSTRKNPVHTYAKAGKYTVSLTVSNAAGSNMVVRSDYITVNALKPPVAAFSASPISGKAQLTVAFTDKSTGSPASYLWDFGDKSSPSTARNPVHKYSKAGKYTVSLTVKNTKGSNSVTKSGYITVK